MNINQAYEGTEIKLLRVLKSDETHCQQHDTTHEGRSLAEESKQLFSNHSIDMLPNRLRKIREIKIMELKLFVSEIMLENLLLGKQIQNN